MAAPRSYANVPLSLAHLCELEVAPPELIDIAARAGFASVGLRTYPASPGGVAYALRTSAEQAEMRRRIAATGVSVLYIELISLSETTRVADYGPMLEAGAAIGARRVAVAGDTSDVAVVADKMAELCVLARGFGIAVDLEFMPFRAVRSLADAVAVVRRAGEVNAHVLIDALHVFRSGSSLADLAALDPRLLGTLQICDAPHAAPAAAELVVEARTRRLFPGQGGLDLAGLMAALPPEIPIGVEVPLAGQYPNLDPAERLARLAKVTRAFLERRSAT